MSFLNPNPIHLDSPAPLTADVDSEFAPSLTSPSRKSPSRTNPTQMSLAGIFFHPDSWSRNALWGSLATSSLLFIFGTLAFVGYSPVLTIGLNLLITGGVFAGMWAVSHLLFTRFTLFWRFVAVTAVFVILSAARGVALYLLASVLGFPEEISLFAKALISVSVFGPGVFLTVVLINVVTDWRHNEALLRDREDQLLSTRETALPRAQAEVRGYVSGIESVLTHRGEELHSADREQAMKILFLLLHDIVKPLSVSLARPTAPAQPTPLSHSRPATIVDLIQMALRQGPVAPLPSGIFFGMMLIPRAVVLGNILDALILTVVLGLVVAVGLTLTNRLSIALHDRLSSAVLTAVLLIQVSIVGLCVAAVTTLLAPAYLGLGTVWIVAPITVMMVAFFVGGIQAVGRHAASQHARIQETSELLASELAATQSFQWHQRRALSNWLHGPIQATINSALVRLSQTGDNPMWQKHLHEAVENIAAQRDDIHQVLTTTSDLAVTIERISQTWEGIAVVQWHVADGISALAGSQHQAAVADVLVESVFNAVRHSKPELIHVTLAGNGGEGVHLTVLHRGSLPESDIIPGLGTQICEYLTLEFSLLEYPSDAPVARSLQLSPGETAVVFEAHFVA